MGKKKISVLQDSLKSLKCESKKSLMAIFVKS